MAEGPSAPDASPAPGITPRTTVPACDAADAPQPASREPNSGYRLSRPDTPADWRAYHAIRRDVLLESRERAFEHPNDDEELEPRHFPLLFWLGERPIGTIRIDCLEGGLAALRLVAIDPACQGHGHGLRLLRQAELFARDLGCRVVVVYATLEAAGFYARGGYAEEIWDDRCVGGIVQMAKALA